MLNNISLKTLILTSCLCVLSNFIFAQNTSMPKDLDGGKYTPKSTEPKNNKKSESHENRNLIGLSVGHMVRQMAVVSYERAINNRFAARLSLGYCLGKDVTDGLFNDADINSNPYDSKIASTYSLNNDYVQSNNFYTDLTGKIYTNMKFAEYYDIEYKFYAGINYRVYKQTFAFNRSEDIFPTNVKNLPILSSGTQLVIGQMAYREDGLAMEYYIGIGTKSSSFHEMRYNPTSNRYEYNPNKSREKTLLLTFGLIYGLSF
jgi:hypothetical protein